MRLLKIVGWRSLMATGILASLALISTGAEPESGGEKAYDWARLLCRGLYLCYQGEYQNAFEMIQSAVRSKDPGPEVHRCLALMYHAFARTHGLYMPVTEWNPSAKEYLDRLEVLKEPGDADLVILATLKHVHMRSAPRTPSSEPFLDKLIDPVRKSPWRDWAYWEKARVVASKAYVSTRIAWGSVEFLQGDVPRIGCLDEYPAETLRARAAQVFLKDNPDSYMGRTMRLELCLWRVTQARRALAQLAGNEWFTDGAKAEPFPLSEEQVRLVKGAEESLAALSRLFPESVRKLATAETGLDDYLWLGLSNRAVVKYLKTVVEVRGKDAMPVEVYEWLSSVPVVKEPEYEVYSP
jgi:hypothetical protein